MTGRIVPLEPDPHVAVQSLLPWYVTGRLDAAEAARVDEHLPHCDECRAELAAERQWQRLQVASVAQVDVEAGWSAMLARLGQGDAERAGARAEATPGPAAGARGTRSPRRRPAGWASAGPLLRWGWMVPTAAAAALVLSLGLRPGADRAANGPAVVAVVGADAATPAYRALAATPPATGAALVRFRPQATESDIRGALQRCDARIVDGPTVGAAWVVRLPREHYAASLAMLRAQPSVTLAEALESEGGR